MVEEIIPNLKESEKDHLNTTLEQLSRNAAIRTEIICKRKKGKTVDVSFREVGEKFNLDPNYIRKLYYAR